MIEYWDFRSDEVRLQVDADREADVVSFEIIGGVAGAESDRSAVYLDRLAAAALAAHLQAWADESNRVADRRGRR
jgi:hypothetical protein